MAEKFSKYEMARIIGARALQIAMDAPLLLKLSDDDLKAMMHGALTIAEREFEEGVLPIAISRPSPLKRKEKLGQVKVDKVSDEELIAKAQEVEKEIVEDAESLGFVNEGDDDGFVESDSDKEDQ